MSLLKELTSEEQIRQALVSSGLMTHVEANAASIWLGYDESTQQQGWHIKPFGQQVYYVGLTIGAAIATIEAMS